MANLSIDKILKVIDVIKEVIGYRLSPENGVPVYSTIVGKYYDSQDGH